MSEKLTMPKNVQAFVDKYGGVGSKEQDAAFWKEFRKAANAYANVQAKRICDLEHALAEALETAESLTTTAFDLLASLGKAQDERDEARAEMIRWMSIAEGRGRTDDDDTGKAMANLIRERDEAQNIVEKLTEQGLKLMDDNMMLKREIKKFKKIFPFDI